MSRTKLRVWKKTLVDGYTMLVTAVAVGGAVYFWQRKEINRVRSGNMAGRRDLGEEIRRLLEWESQEYQIEEANGSEQTDKNASNTTYKNVEYGFSLPLPKGWEQYKVSQETLVLGATSCEDCTGITYTIFYFLLPLKDSAFPSYRNQQTGVEVPGYYPVFAIDAMNIDNWDQLINSPTCMLNASPICKWAFLGDNNKYVFNYGGPSQDLPPYFSSVSLHFIPLTFTANNVDP